MSSDLSRVVAMAREGTTYALVRVHFDWAVVCPILLKTQTKLFYLHVTCRMASSSVYPYEEYLLPFHSMQCGSLLSNYTFLPYFNITYIYIYATNFCRLKYLIGSDVDVDNKLILRKRFKWGLRSDKLKGFAGEILFFQKNSATTSPK